MNQFLKKPSADVYFCVVLTFVKDCEIKPHDWFDFSSSEVTDCESVCLLWIPARLYNQDFQDFPPHTIIKSFFSAVYWWLCYSSSVRACKMGAVDVERKQAEPARLPNCRCQVCLRSIWFPSGWYIGHVQIETENISALLLTYPSGGFPAGVHSLALSRKKKMIEVVFKTSQATRQTHRWLNFP